MYFLMSKFLACLVFVISKYTPVAITSYLVVNFYLNFSENVTLVW